MRTNNPVLSRPDAFTPGYQQQGYPQGFQADAYYNPQQQGYAPGQPQDAFQQTRQTQPASLGGRMTIDDVITKTALLLLVVVAAAGMTMMLLPVQLLMPVAIVGSLAAVVTVFIVAARRTIWVPGIFGYAVVEGVVIGALSKLFEYLYPGIVMQAVLGTIVAAFVVLAAYKFLGVRVRGRFARIVTMSIIAYAVVALINLFMIIGGVSIGLTAIGANAGPLAWLFSGIGVVLAVSSLLMDFEAIENGVRMGAPESESWRGAFGLTVTLIWLYTQILRILSYFRN